jgi:ABC-type branched-subunit amino acid transport system substrate-binding protein
MSRSGQGFPPRLGWLPILFGVATVCAIGAVQASPQFVTRVVGVQQNGSTTAQGAVPGGDVPGRGGSAGHSVTVGGASGGASTGGVAAGQQGAITCAASRNGGSSAPGVSANEIHVASTKVTTGVGQGFLGDAVNGIQAAINEANGAGGVCGRRISFESINTNWDPTAGNQDIADYIASDRVFALVGEPDSEGLRGAIDAGTIDRAGMPVVGTDGMLRDQYRDPWVFPVAASTVTNMHVIAQYAVSTLKAQSFGIVYDTAYKFGAEGASAFDAEVRRLTGRDIAGFGSSGCSSAYCGISSQSGSYTTEITAFDNACKPCQVVVLLLEPQPAETWMKGEEDAKDENGNPTWYQHLFGAEPLFDDTFASTCGGDCGRMVVWTGYHPAIQPFDGENPVVRYIDSLKAACPSCDPHNEFTEGAYIGTKLFIEACRRVNADGLPLTRANLRAELEKGRYDIGLTSQALHFSGVPHLSNEGMAAYSDNALGSFNGWNYLETGFLPDPAPGSDLGG